MPPSESTPLVHPGDADAADHDPHKALFDPLDAEHSHDDVHDHPPRLHRIKSALTSATTAPGHGHPVHHHLQSPALLLRLRQSFEHGFHTVWTAVHHGVHSLPHPPSSPSSPRIATRAVFAIAILTMLAMTSVSPTLLLFMNHSGYTSPSHIAPYVTASALSTAVPVVSNLLLTSLASRVGPGRALTLGSLVAAFGLLCIAQLRSSLLVFLFAYALYASSNSMRILRVSLLSKIVAPETRTSVLATHALMTPIGALMGPLIWIACQAYRGSFHVGPGVLVDRFSMVYSIAAASFAAIAAVSTWFLGSLVTYGHEHDEHADVAGADMQSGHLHEAVLHFADGHDQAIDLHRYRDHVFRYFCAIMLGVNMSAGIFMTAFQPVLVNVFHTSDANLGLVFETIAVFAIVPPLLVALLSRFIMDRHILVIGLIAKLFGMMLFLPLFGPVREWQVIMGFLLIVKASIFFSTASMSLFTKLLGPMSTSSLLGLLASGSSIGPAVAQILLSKHIVEWFGSMWFGAFAIPTVLSLAAILWPSRWRKLDPSGEFTQLVTHEAELQQAEDG